MEKNFVKSEKSYKKFAGENFSRWKSRIKKLLIETYYRCDSKTSEVQKEKVSRKHKELKYKFQEFTCRSSRYVFRLTGGKQFNSGNFFFTSETLWMPFSVKNLCHSSSWRMTYEFQESACSSCTCVFQLIRLFPFDSAIFSPQKPRKSHFWLNHDLMRLVNHYDFMQLSDTPALAKRKLQP